MLTVISLYNTVVGIILGIVQGISEWLPISSKTQVLLVGTFLLHLNFSQAYALGLFMEGGTTIAAIIYFRNEIYKTLLALAGRGGKEGRLLLKYLIIVTIITAVIAVPIYLYVSAIGGPVIGVPMIVLGILLITDGIIIKLSKGRQSADRTLPRLTTMDFILVGVSQGIAALPGVSRSGATVSAMLFLKIRPEEAFRLSFFAGILATLGAAGVTVIFSKSQLRSIFAVLPIQYIVIASIVSIAVSLVLIRTLINSAKSGKIISIVFALGLIAIIGGTIGMLTGIGG